MTQSYKDGTLYELLDTPPEGAFNDLAVLTSRALDAPIAAVSLTDESQKRQFFKSAVGLPDPVLSSRQVPFSHSFCKHVSRSNHILRVSDARLDPRVSENASITEIGVVAYLGQPIHAPDGTSIGSMCVLDTKPRDWTDVEADTLLRISKMVDAQIALRATRAMLQEESDYLNDLLETLPTAVTGLNGHGQMVFANPAAQALFGLDEHEVNQLNFNDIKWNIETIDGDEFPIEDLPFSRIQAGEDHVEGVVHAIYRPDGSRRLLSIDAARSRRSQNHTAVICAISDVTEQVKFEERLQEALAHSDAANRAKSAFLANMSHEIRTPINGILGLSELLSERVQEAEAANFVSAIRQSSEALLMVINPVLDLAKIEAGKFSLTSKPFDLLSMLVRLQKLHTPCAQSKGVAFQPLEYVQDSVFSRIGDEFRVSQIIGNLIGNAVKFTSSGSITVSVSKQNNELVEITVADTGIGMTPDQVRHATEKFEQADASSTRNYDGLGLGLPVAKALIELMDGYLKIESNLERGTCVTVGLPIPVAPHTHRAPDSVSLSASNVDVPPGLRILVAEDNATNALILSMMLKSFHAEVIMVTNGQAACNTWQHGKFDLLIFDISMPVLDGLDALAHIHNQCAERQLPPPVSLAVTANAMKHQVESYLDHGFSAVLTKPFDKERLGQLLIGLSQDAS